MLIFGLGCSTPLNILIKNKIYAVINSNYLARGKKVSSTTAVLLLLKFPPILSLMFSLNISSRVGL